ncbi:unnamed protein product [Pleuronectes platessa]|uniref:Uncharacterized protein n=1 Tax=Pleuronectes platessa TaxID=8262 RepID=A0A9N7W170_PLEPL|nr:unnamed protein product [Pleuronectes platessa]
MLLLLIDEFLHRVEGGFEFPERLIMKTTEPISQPHLPCHTHPPPITHLPSPTSHQPPPISLLRLRIFAHRSILAPNEGPLLCPDGDINTRRFRLSTHQNRSVEREQQVE